MTDVLRPRGPGVADLPSIIALLAADTLGWPWRYDERRTPCPTMSAPFGAIAASPNDTLYVAELGGAVVGTFQTTMITSLTGRGGNEPDDRGGADQRRHARARGSARR